MNLSGRAFIYRYASGLEVLGRFLDGDKVAWETRSGPSAGQSGTEHASITEIRPGLFFASWVETSGVTVSQVLDLDRQRVLSFVSFDTPAGRRAASDEGVLEALA